MLRSSGLFVQLDILWWWID